MISIGPCYLCRCPGTLRSGPDGGACHLCAACLLDLAEPAPRTGRPRATQAALLELIPTDAPVSAAALGTATGLTLNAVSLAIARARTRGHRIARTHLGYRRIS